MQHQERKNTLKSTEYNRTSEIILKQPNIVCDARKGGTKRKIDDQLIIEPSLEAKRIKNMNNPITNYFSKTAAKLTTAERESSGECGVGST